MCQERHQNVVERWPSFDCSMSQWSKCINVQLKSGPRSKSDRLLSVPLQNLITCLPPFKPLLKTFAHSHSCSYRGPWTESLENFMLHWRAPAVVRTSGERVNVVTAVRDGTALKWCLLLIVFLQLLAAPVTYMYNVLY